MLAALQMAAMYTALQSGSMVLPQLIKEIRSPSGEIIESMEPKLWKEGLYRSSILKHCFPCWWMVENPTGTAHKVKDTRFPLPVKPVLPRQAAVKKVKLMVYRFYTGDRKPLLVCIALEVPAGQEELNGNG